MSSFDEPSGDSGNDVPVGRKGRGSTHMGPEEDNFISYVGYLARSKVRIVFSHWKLVPPKMKELIWA